MTVTAITTGYPLNTRNIVDGALSNTVAFSASGSGTATSGWLNLGQPGALSAEFTSNFTGNTSGPAGSINSPAGPYVATEKVLLNVVVGASANGGNASNGGGNVLVYLQGAPTLANGAVDSGNITNVPLRSAFATGNIAYTGAVATGTNAAATNPTAAVNLKDALPPNIPQYIRLYAVNGANVGNVSDASMTIQLLF